MDMSTAIWTAYYCGTCDVSGRTQHQPPICWMCEQPAKLTARITLKTKIIDVELESTPT